MLRDAFLIARRDFRANFTSPIAYIVMASFLALMGYFFLSAVAAFLQATQNFSQYTQGPRPTVTEFVVQGLFQTMGVILLFLVPAITMRLFAEERRDRTDVLLLSAPVHPFSIILGKFFSGVGFMCVMLMGTLPYPLILILYSNVEIGVLFSSYLGLILLVSSFVAVGIFFSAITENQVIAFVLTMGLLLFLWVIAGAAYSAGPIWSEIVNYVSIYTHYNSMGTGMLDSSDVLYYLSVIALGLFSTYLAFDANEWN